jgi:hypothetical protein
MVNSYECKICNLIYKTNEGFTKHNKKYHSIDNATPKKYTCENCKRNFNSRQTKWKHVQICTKKDNLITSQVATLTDKIKILEETIKQQPKQNMKSEKSKIKVSNVNLEIIETLTNKLCEKDLTIANLKEQQNNHNDDIDNSKNRFNEFIMPEKINIANNIFTSRSSDHYFNASQICNETNKKLADWIEFSTTNDVLIELQKETDLQLIISENEDVWIHPFLVLFLTQWISPIFLLQLYSQLNFQVNKLTIENSNLCNIIKKKDNELSTLKNIFVRKHTRTNYPDKNVLYLITTEQNKANRIYIVGKAGNLKERLGTYNKTCVHEVIYYKSCVDKTNMNLCEQSVLNKLNKYREVANRDRFVLPIDKDISFFTNIFDLVIDFHLSDTVNKNSVEIEI